MDLHTATMNQLIAHEILTGGEEGDDFLKGHVRLIREVYRERRDTMLDAMERYFPEDVSWTKPAGGLFLWVTLPEFLDATKLLKTAIENKVAFVPGDAFHPHGDGRNSLRLNFSYCNPEKINIGIQRLGQVINLAIEEHYAGKMESDTPVFHTAF